MPSIRALYNDEAIQAHREALAKLRELLSQEKDPLELRKLANAILRAPPAKDLPPPSPCSEEEGARRSGRTDVGSSPSAIQRHAAVATAADLDDLDDTAHCEIDTRAHQVQYGPNQLDALQKLRAIMKGNMETITANANAPETPLAQPFS